MSVQLLHVNHRSAHVVVPQNQSRIRFKRSIRSSLSAIIVIIKEYRGAIVSALDDVMKISGNGNSRQPGDAASRTLSIQ
jgi:hypothetical protein